ncbi:MAG: tRNA pseudouridine(38-40) synthase TruA [Nitrospirales bacterium]|nr:tRNA pseudouridine(38-40) synthase TruA [Nitrospirales bacterium]
MSTYKLILEYDGTAYAGWQCQPDQPTIQASLESVLQDITQAPVAVIAAGRTDAGVHALGQVVSFRSDKPLTDPEWMRALNGLLPKDISVKHIERVADTFHARYNALAKIYEYRILNCPYRSALKHERVWHISQSLNIRAMQQASDLFLGKHDFSSFQASRTDTENPVCTIQQLRLIREKSILRIHIQADRFLKHMVRALVGTLVEIGRGKRDPANITGILNSIDRRCAGRTAPPQGLYLVHVFYNDEENNKDSCRS